MADESPVGSPLSDLSSDAFGGEEAEHERLASEALMPPAKRQKLEGSSARATPVPFQDDDNISISTDTSGDIPSSPPRMRPDDDDPYEQVTACQWLGCTAGDLGNLDKLIEHIHNEHIESRSKKYPCEWSDCPRRGITQASAYALKGHMRSHTREKPFYCSLPECDRSFVRGDALTKHMRAVHDPDELRNSEPGSRPIPPPGKPPRLRLVLKPARDASGGLPPLKGHINGVNPPGWTSSYPPGLAFTAEEEARGPEQLFRLLRRQVQWAEEEQASLKKQCEAMEELRKKEWKEKEVLLSQVISSEATWQQTREKVLAGMADNLPGVSQPLPAAVGSEQVVAPSHNPVPELAEDTDSSDNAQPYIVA